MSAFEWCLCIWYSVFDVFKRILLHASCISSQTVVILHFLNVEKFQFLPLLKSVKNNFRLAVLPPPHLSKKKIRGDMNWTWRILNFPLCLILTFAVCRLPFRSLPTISHFVHEKANQQTNEHRKKKYCYMKNYSGIW